MTSVVRPRREPIERLADLGFADRVEVRGGLVQDQDRRILQQGAGDRDALTLAARKLQAALADGRVVAIGQRLGKLVDVAPRAPPRGLVVRGVRGDPGGCFRAAWC